MSEVALRARQTYTVRELRLDLPESGSLVLSVGGPHAISVACRAAENDDDAVCSAEGTFPLSDKMREAFTALGEHRLPSGHPPPDEDALDRGIRADGRFDPNLAVSPSDLPRGVADCVANISGELVDTLTRTILILRWRHSGTGDHRPFSSHRPEWTMDGSRWHPLPRITRGIGEVKDWIKTSPDSVSEVETMVRQDVSEPVGHSLLREAWEQRIRNPRSAIVIGVAALEVGVKQCIATLEPASQWLMENLPSPPVVTLLTDYLPTLKAQSALNGMRLGPPKGIIQTLHKAVHQRNRVAHATGETTRKLNVHESLAAIRDVLWLLDFYQGHAWALGHMRRDTRSALTGSSEGDRREA